MKNVMWVVVLAAFVLAVPVMAEEAAKAPAAPAVAQKHLLAIKDGTASYCGCGADCKACKLGDDGTKCTCGKDVTKESLKGKYVCEKDLVVADKEGKCPTCGADLKLVQ